VTTPGVDYAWTHPGGAALAAAGMRFACRYLSTDPSKNLTRAEADDLAAHGVSVVAVWESTAKRARSGKAAGIADAEAALSQATAAGMPHGRPLYFAIDYDVPAAVQPAIDAYFEGVASVIGPARTGAYGGYWPLSRLKAKGLATWFWQTAGWSGSNRLAGMHLWQPATTTKINGVSCDHDTAMTTDYGQWTPGKAPTATTEEDDMPTPAEIAKAVWDADVIPAARPPHANADYAKNKTWQAKYALQTSVEGTRATAAQLTALSAAVKSLAGQLGKSPADVETIVAAVQKAVAEATIHVTVSGPGPDPAKG
jgi:hypothetical protein